MGYSPWGRKEWDTTEQLHFTSYTFNLLPGSKLGNEQDKVLFTWKFLLELTIQGPLTPCGNMNHKMLKESFANILCLLTNINFCQCPRLIL